MWEREDKNGIRKAEKKGSKLHIMYNGIGLASVRGSATSGHVQGNKSYVRPSSTRYRVKENFRSNRQHHGEDRNKIHRKKKKNNIEIMEHEQKRQFEIEMLELRDKLEDDGRFTEQEIESRICRERKEYELRIEKRKQMLEQKRIQKKLEEKEKEEVEEGEEKDEKINDLVEVDGKANVIRSKNGALCIAQADSESKVLKSGRYTQPNNQGLYNNYRYPNNESYRHNRYIRNTNSSNGFSDRRRSGNGKNQHYNAMKKEDENTNMRYALGIRESQYKEGEIFMFYFRNVL